MFKCSLDVLAEWWYVLVEWWHRIAWWNVERDQWQPDIPCCRAPCSFYCLHWAFQSNICSVITHLIMELQNRDFKHDQGNDNPSTIQVATCCYFLTTSLVYHIQNSKQNYFVTIRIVNIDLCVVTSGKYKQIRIFRRAKGHLTSSLFCC